jgi:hypothetical protein
MIIMSIDEKEVQVQGGIRINSRTKFDWSLSQEYNECKWNNSNKEETTSQLTSNKFQQSSVETE